MTTAPAILDHNALHRKSPVFFFISLGISIALTGAVLVTPYRVHQEKAKKAKPAPVIITMQNIPKTMQTVSAPAPALSAPMEIADDLMPDDITIGNTTLDLQGAAPAAPPPPAAVVKKEEAAKKVDEEMYEFISVEEKPTVIENAAPQYPEAARRAGIEGTVFVSVELDKEGNVTAAVVLKGPSELHAAALEAARSTRFKPARQNDKPVPCKKVVLPFRFVLEKK